MSNNNDGPPPHRFTQEQAQLTESLAAASVAMQHCSVLMNNFSVLLQRHPLVVSPDGVYLQVSGDAQKAMFGVQYNMQQIPGMFLNQALPPHAPALVPLPPAAAPVAKGGRKRKAADDDDEDDADEGKKKRVVKKLKDPNAPKRPASSYIMFQNEIRGQLRAENPTLPNNELLTLIAKHWAEMSADEKHKYEMARAVQKDLYETAKNKYDARSPEEKAATTAELQAAQDAAPVKRTRKRKDPKAAVSTPDTVPEEDADMPDDEPAVAPTKLAKANAKASSSNPAAPAKVAAVKPASKAAKAPAPIPPKPVAVAVDASSEGEESDDESDEEATAPPNAHAQEESDEDDEEEEEDEDQVIQTPAAKKAKTTAAPATNGRPRK